MTKEEALRLALEALEVPWNSPYVDGCDLALGKKVKAITAIKAALEAKDEPVAWEQFYPDIGKPQIAFNPEVVGYVAPQTWVGLTVEEKVLELMFDAEGRLLGYEEYANAIEAKLKEKNT